MHPEFDADGTHAWDVQAPDPHDRDEPHLPAVVGSAAGARRARSRQPPARAPEPLPRGCRESCATSRLQVSGLLGEQVRRPQRAARISRDGYLAALNFPKREYSASHGDDLYRRGVYTFWQRTFLHPEPADLRCADARGVHRQPQHLEHAAAGARSAERSDLRRSGARLRAEHRWRSGGQTFDAAARLGLRSRAEPRARPRRSGRILRRPVRTQPDAVSAPIPASARALIARRRGAAAAERATPAELAAMTTVTRAILNLHEPITRN